MKRKTIILLSIIYFGLFNQRTIINAQTKLLHYWHFNITLPLSGAGGIHFGTNKMNSDYTKSGITTGYLQFVKTPLCVKDTGYWDNLAGDSINQRIGFGNCCPIFGSTTSNSAIRTRNPTDSMMFLWYIPTKNFKNIKLSWGVQSSSTSSGQHRINYTYSVDSGATFITSGLPQLYDSAGTGWGKITLNLSAINAVNNTNKLMLRILFSAPNNGSSGNTRFDNIAVEGDSLATIATGMNQPNITNNNVKLYPNPTDGIIHLQMEAYPSGKKTILVTNLIGETLLSLNTDEDDISINDSSLTKGLYFFTIISKNGENKNTVKFIKN